MRLPDPRTLNRWGLRALGVVALLLLAGAAWRLAAPGGRSGAARTPQDRPAGQRMVPAPPSSPSPVARRPAGQIVPRAGDPPPERQTAALRQAVSDGALNAVRLAVLRGDAATVRGMMPALRRDPEASARGLRKAARETQDPSTRKMLENLAADLH